MVADKEDVPPRLGPLQHVGEGGEEGADRRLDQRAPDGIRDEALPHGVPLQAVMRPVAGAVHADHHQHRVAVDEGRLRGEEGRRGIGLFQSLLDGAAQPAAHGHVLVGVRVAGRRAAPGELRVGVDEFLRQPGHLLEDLGLEAAVVGRDADGFGALGIVGDAEADEEGIRGEMRIEQFEEPLGEVGGRSLKQVLPLPHEIHERGHGTSAGDSSRSVIIRLPG